MPSEFGRVQIGVDQPQGGRRYPFLYDTDDELELLIADLFLHYTDDSRQFAVPFRIDFLSNFGTIPAVNPTGEPHAMDISIVDSNDVQVFDSLTATSYEETIWGDHKKIIEWANDSGDVLRVVVFTAWSEDTASIERDWDSYFEPGDAWLDPRSYEERPRALRSIAVVTDLADQNADIVLDTGVGIDIQAGYNVLLTVEPETVVDGAKLIHEVTIDVVSGAGAGQFPCEPTRYIRRINGVAADLNGNFLLTSASNKPRPDGGGCYRVERPLAAVSPGIVSATAATLRVSNDCVPCCTCDDYINVYEAIRVLSLRYAELGMRAEIVRDQYLANRTRWEDGRACRENASLQLALQPIVPDKIAVAMALCNTSDLPMKDVELRLCFQYGPDSNALSAVSTTVGCPICGTVYRRGNVDPLDSCDPRCEVGDKPYSLIGSWPSYSVEFDCIDPGTNGFATFVMEFPLGTSSDDIEAVLRAFGEDVNNALPVKKTTNLVTSYDYNLCCSESASSLSDGPPCEEVSI